MKRLIVATALCTVTITGGAAFAAISTTGAQMTHVTLKSVAGNRSATATLIDAGAAGTRMVVEVGRTPQGLANPRVYAGIREGSCDGSFGESVYELSAPVNQYMPGGMR